MNDDARLYWLALKRIPGWGPVTLRQKFSRVDSIVQVWHELELDSVAKSNLLDQAKAEIDTCHNLDIHVLTFDQTGYPKLLQDVIDIEPVIYAKGRLDIVKNINVAIVGNRKYTPYGAEVTQQLATQLSAAGCTIVSGMALGIDTIAHQATLETGGSTIAVWGSGLDQVFPSSNLRLAQQIVAQGLVLSQFGPGVRASNFTFPARNGLIAALSEAVVVTEAQADSGSLITAQEARRYGKVVWAVPGSIYSPGSVGPHQLLSEGARLAVDAAAIVNSLGIQAGDLNTSSTPTVSASADEQVVLDALSQSSQSMDQLIRASQLTPSQAMSIVSMLEMKGLIKNVGGEYRKA